MRQRLHLRADPVDDAELALRLIARLDVLHQHVEKIGQVVRLKLPVHVALPEPDVRVPR